MPESSMRTMVWFRGKDLRVSDHAPLADAAAKGSTLPVFVLDPYFFAPERAQKLPHRMQFLLESLESLAANLAQLGAPLLVVAGRSVDVLPKLVADLRPDRVVAHHWSEPFARERDERVARTLSVPFELFAGETLAPPARLLTDQGNVYRVFTPFARSFRKAITISKPTPAPRTLKTWAHNVTSVPIPSLSDLGIERNPRLLPGGERAARARMATFFKGPANEYEAGRDRMDLPGTSRLSVDLKFGTLSVQTVWNETLAKGPPGAWRDRFTSELLWREFSYYSLWHRPSLLTQPFRDDFRDFPWRDDADRWRAWVTGTTGYPVVDAAARQLLGEGFVHNRARMISASFLTKHLGISYQRGEVHYMQYLTDGDWAPNNMGWQWSAGCGCDAQPYFRVFNPMTQGKRFDPLGHYVQKWVPELARLPERWIHSPWEAPPVELRAAGVELGKTYPQPIVEHATARATFLALAKQHLGASAS